jgi:glycosyltransferase involved in cell wall biosynthesis
MPRNRFSHENKRLDIVFYVISTHGEKLHELDYSELYPVGGSETAALRLADALQKLGHTIRFITDNDKLNGLTCDVFISLRIWQIFQAGIFPGKVNYLWCHDDANQPIVEDLRKPEIAIPLYNRLDGLFMLSSYQQVQWIVNLNVMIEKIIPTTNGIPLDKFQTNPNTLRQRKPWAYYASTPFRGLNLLLHAWPDVRKAVPNAQLHVFTSMKLYQAEETQEYEDMYAAARSLPGSNYHGAVGQAELRETAQKCRALAYPCTFSETSCITAMEAMAAGCAVVSTSTGALLETAWHNPLVVPGGNWLSIWTKALIKVLTDDEEYEQLALQNLDIAKYYDWGIVARQWIKKFKEDLTNKL